MQRRNVYEKVVIFLKLTVVVKCDKTILESTIVHVVDERAQFHLPKHRKNCFQVLLVFCCFLGTKAVLSYY
jgi:hypothetical protein